MNLRVGSVVNMTAAPAGWLVDFTEGEEKWTLPVVGWATYVQWKEEDEDGEGDTNTDLDVVVLVEEICPVPLTEYLRDHCHGKAKARVYFKAGGEAVLEEATKEEGS